MLEFLRLRQQAVIEAPESALERGKLAMAYDANGFVDAAEGSYAQAAQLDAAEFRWPYFRAGVLAQRGELQAAVESLDDALDLNPDYPAAHLQRGAWLMDLDRHDAALIAYRRAAALARDKRTQACATVGVGRALLRRGQLDEATPLLENLASRFDHPYILHVLSDAYRRSGRIADLDRIVDRSNQSVGRSQEDPLQLTWPDPTRAEKSAFVRGFSGKMLIAKSYLTLAQPARALEVLESLGPAHPRDRDLLNNLSIAYRLSGRADESMATLRLGLAAHPDFHAFHYNIAVHHEERGEVDLALQHLDRAIASDPGFSDAHARKVNVLTRAGQLKEALAAVEVFQLLGRADANVLVDAGMLAGALERWPLAIERFRQAVRLDPTHRRGQLFLGRSLGEAGRYEEARVALAEAERLGVAPGEISDALSRLARLERAQ